MISTILLSAVFGCCVCALAPALLFVINLCRYRAPEGKTNGAPVSVLIPARDEERNIGQCLDCVLQSRGVALEVIVLDDGSTDRTAKIVRDVAARDPRVRMIEGCGLPAGWNGKQHACWLLAQEASSELFLFLDADVRLAADAVVRCVGQMQTDQLSLLSGFPRQITVGWMEKLLLPLIHFVLLSFLPMGKMRRSTATAYAAGCGQFFLAEREAYFASGGHAGIRSTRHDGLKLPTLFRRHGFRTDIFDLTELAAVRMYDSAAAVWGGLAKNATEGIATPGRIVPFTLLLLLGQVMPVFLFSAWLAFAVECVVVGATVDQPLMGWAVSFAVVIAFVSSYLPRLLAVKRFKQPLISAVLHPVGVAGLLAVQWYALVRQSLGRPVSWRARSYSSETGEEVG